MQSTPTQGSIKTRRQPQQGARGKIKGEEETHVDERRKKSCVKESRRSRRTLTEQTAATVASAEMKAIMCRLSPQEKFKKFSSMLDSKNENVSIFHTFRLKKTSVRKWKNKIAPNQTL